MDKLLHLIVFAFLTIPLTGNTQIRIDDFEVKENLTSNGKVAIIALDTVGNADETVNGTFLFAINSFEQSLLFHNGVAVPSHPVDGSTFVYFKHKNQHKTTGKLYFIHKKENKINPYKINGLVLILIPAFFLFIAYAFKKFIYAFLLLAVVYVYLHYSKGLDLSKIIESALEAIKNLV